MNEHHEFGDDVILIRISRQITFGIERKRLGAVELNEQHWRLVIFAHCFHLRDEPSRRERLN